MDLKKMAAATAAVMTYIKTQEESASFGLPQEEKGGPFLAVRMNTWGMAGRSDQMQNRSMMQMGIFR
jgi:hypothetical protein